MRFFAEFILSLTTRFFAALRMTYEGLRMTNLHFKLVTTQPPSRRMTNSELINRLYIAPKLSDSLVCHSGLSRIFPCFKKDSRLGESLPHSGGFAEEKR
jgi:hypothetical protein